MRECSVAIVILCDNMGQRDPIGLRLTEATGEIVGYRS
jgi:hypothetical protein